MNATNPKLTLALDNCPAVLNPIKEWNDHMTHMSQQVALDRYDNRGAQYNRNTFTVAGMLCLNTNLRELLRKAGGDLKQFDSIVSQAHAIMLQHSNKPNSAAKVASVLNKLTGQL